LDTPPTISIVQDPVPIVQDPVPIVQDPVPIVQDPVPIVQDPVPIVQPSVQVVRAPEVFATECPTTDSSEEYSSDEDEIVPNTHGVSHHQRTTLCKRDALVVLNEISKKYTQTVPESIIQDLIYIICLTNGKGGDFHMKNQLYAGKLQLAQFILMIEYAYNFKYSDHEDVIGGGILVNIHENFVKNENT
jgi:hypothetical protein